MSTERSDPTEQGNGAMSPSAGEDRSAEPTDNGNGNRNDSLGSFEEDGSVVDWREQLRERVRQIRARKMAAQRAAETGFDDPREVAETVAASAARARELKKLQGDEPIPSDEGADATDEGADATDAPEPILDAATDDETTTTTADTRELEPESAETTAPDTGEDDADATDPMEGLGAESDRAYAEADTPEHTTFELEEPAISTASEPGATSADREAEPGVPALDFDEDAEASTPVEPASPDLQLTPGPTEPASTPDSLDDVPLFQDDPELFDEGPALPERDSSDGDDGVADAPERAVDGWWPRPRKDDSGPTLPAEADIPAWARSQARRARGASSTESDERAEAPPRPPEIAAAAHDGDDAEPADPTAEDRLARREPDPDAADDPTETASDATDADPGDAGEDEADPASESGSAGPSELADVPIPAWARPRKRTATEPEKARQDDVHLIGEFHGRGKSSSPGAGASTPAEHTTIDDAPKSPADDAEEHSSPRAGDADTDSGRAAAHPEPESATDAERGDEREPMSALEELLGQTEAMASDPADDDVSTMPDDRGSETAEASTQPPDPTSRAASPEPGAGDEAPAAPSDSSPEPRARPAAASSAGSEGDLFVDDLLPDHMDRGAPDPEPSAATDQASEQEPLAAGVETPAEDDPRSADAGAVPAAARSGLDLEPAGPATSEGPDMEWDLDEPGDPDTVLEAQKPRRRVDESSAPLSDRFFSTLCDGLVLLGVALLLLAAASRAADTAMVEVLRNTPWPLLATWLVFAFSYAVLFNGTCGQTLGKMIMRVRVIGAERFHIGYGRAARRAASYMLATLPAGLGLLPALRDAQHRALHDRLSGTRVVKA